MAKGKRAKSKLFKKGREEEEKQKPDHNEGMKKSEESVSNKGSSRMFSYFKGEELQDICGLMNVEELGDHHCFLGAVVIGKFDVVKKLLKDGVCIDTMDENHETALMHAVKHFRFEMVDFLVARGADISLVDGEGNNAVLLAAQSSVWDQDSFSALWGSVRDHPWLRPNHTNKAGYSLLHYITKRQWKLVLESLLSRSLNLDVQTNKGVTPLILAASRGDAASVRALLDNGADFTVEDQQKCTALCYAIAFSVQKNGVDAKQAVELILAAVNDEDSKLPLEVYLQRRLEVLVSPPKTKSEFSKTVTSVLIHVLTFFARFIYSGMDLLLELSVFHRLKEMLILAHAVECHMEDAPYTAAVMAVVLELVRHNDQCCQEGLSQHELADAFFKAGLGKCCLDILTRHRTGKTVLLKVVFMPLVFTCTSESYKARTWLESHHEFLQSFYNKYMRSFPALFLETNGDLHLELEKKNSVSFQKIMKTLKAHGQIVTKEEHCKAAQKLKVNNTTPAYTVSKTNTPSGYSNSFKTSLEKKLNAYCEKRKIPKTSDIYNSIIQYNFGKLDIVRAKKDVPNELPEEKQSNQDKSFKSAQNEVKSVIKEKKSRIAIKEIQQKLTSGTCEQSLHSDQNGLDDSGVNNSKTLPEHMERNTSTININLSEKSPVNNEIKGQFLAGYQLFKMDEELNETNSENENIKDKNPCEWMDTIILNDGNNVVSDAEVANTMNCLEEHFNRIVERYNSTWKRQWEEGYLGAEGNNEDRLKLKQILPPLESYHINKFILKWKKYCKTIQDHARKNRIIYADTVSKMQLHLLDIEAEVDREDIEIHEHENLSLNSKIATENIVESKNCTEFKISSSTNKQVQILINTCSAGSTENTTEESNKNKNMYTNIQTVDVIDSIVISESEEEYNDLNKSVWDSIEDDMFMIEPSINSNKCTENTNVKISEEIPVSKEAEKVEINKVTQNEYAHSILEKSDNNNENCHLTPVLANENKDNNTTNVLNNFNLNQLSVMPLQNGFDQYSKNESCADSKMAPPKIEKEEIIVINESPAENKPPGFENIGASKPFFEIISSALTYCSTKYKSLSLALVTLPACKTELLGGGNLRIASLEYQAEFKLFHGYNFGDVELGLSSTGIPQAVRRFQKHNTLCTKRVSSTLYKQITNMLGINHQHVLAYMACYDLPGYLVFAMPLCYLDLCQYIRHIRSEISKNQESMMQLSPKLLTLAKQLMSGLHYLHTLSTPVVHGNLKPTNVFVDINWNLRVAEFGVHEALFQQQRPNPVSMIWWSRECLIQYQNSWKYECTQQTDIQSAGMLLHYILTIGQHPYGRNLTDIIENIKKGVVLACSQDAIAKDLIYWMLSKEPDKRPTTYDVLRHVLFWSMSKRWEFLLTCCGMTSNHKSWPLPLDQLYGDLDLLGKLRDVNSKWISVLKKNCEYKIGSSVFEDTPSGLLKFIKKNLDNWSDVKDIFLELFPLLPLNLFQLVEQTIWIDHPEFEPFTRVDPLS